MAKRYPPKFKFQIVIELLQSERRVDQLAKSYNVHPNSILKIMMPYLTLAPHPGDSQSSQWSVPFSTVLLFPSWPTN
jgi:hypothetical protein